MHSLFFLALLLLLPLIVLAAGSLLNLSSNPHWFVRGWDFPRIQIVVIGWLITGLFGLLEYFVGGTEPITWIWFVGIAVALTLWHGVRIIPYTPLMPKQVKSTLPNHRQDHHADVATIRMVVSNVKEENVQYDRWRQVMADADPDVLVMLEADETWVRAAEPLFDRYPHRIIQTQDNWYGMMMLSRLPIEKHQVRFLVQEDIPSIDAEVRLANDQIVRIVAVHPRPPEPWLNNDAVARDAELTLWGKELGDEERPTIIGGDLNDVAWSATTRLFLRTSGLLDPRRGRGFFNTFHADYWYCRFPLDHIFHSPHFTLSEIIRLPHIGSDHFAMLIDLRHEPECRDEHEVLEEQEGDDAEIDLRIDRAREDEEVTGDAVDREPEHAISR